MSCRDGAVVSNFHLGRRRGHLWFVRLTEGFATAAWPVACCRRWPEEMRRPTARGWLVGAELGAVQSAALTASGEEQPPAQSGLSIELGPRLAARGHHADHARRPRIEGGLNSLYQHAKSAMIPTGIPIAG